MPAGLGWLVWCFDLFNNIATTTRRRNLVFDILKLLLSEAKILTTELTQSENCKIIAWNH